MKRMDTLKMAVKCTKMKSIVSSKLLIRTYSVVQFYQDEFKSNKNKNLNVV